jgi:hypothetical protein
VRYTIREGIKVFELALANTESASGSSFWLEVERQNGIPRRTGESMRNFWKEKRNKGLELYLKSAVAHDQDRFSHAFKHLLRPTTGPGEPTPAQQQAEARLFEAANNKMIDHNESKINYKLHGVNDLNEVYNPRDRRRVNQAEESELIINNTFAAMNKVKPKKKDQMKESN